MSKFIKKEKEKKKGVLVNNVSKNKSKLYMEFGAILIGIISIVGSYIPKAFGNSDPLLSMLIIGIVAVCIPGLQRLTAMVFGNELTKKVEDLEEKFDKKLTTKDEVINSLITENLQLKIDKHLTLERLDLEQDITEWKLKACAADEDYRLAIQQNKLWEKIEGKRQEILPKRD